MKKLFEYCIVVHLWFILLMPPCQWRELPFKYFKQHDDQIEQIDSIEYHQMWENLNTSEPVTVQFSLYCICWAQTLNISLIFLALGRYFLFYFDNRDITDLWVQKLAGRWFTAYTYGKYSKKL